MKYLFRIVALVFNLVLLSGLSSCSNGASNSATAAVVVSVGYTIGGTVSGLASGQSLTLLNNGTNPLTISQNESFNFSNPIESGGSYVVTVSKQPTQQICSVTNSSGYGVNSNINSLRVICSTVTYSVGGNVSGLASGQSLILKNNDDNSLLIAKNGGFTFTTPVAAASSYKVTVAAQPSGQACTVSHGSAYDVKANISNISVKCSSDTYTIGGTVSGLASSQSVTLLNNASDPLTLKGNGNFIFTTPVVFDGSYSVTVGTEPTNQICTVSHGNGSGVNANVNNISVKCSNDNYTIGGTISGLDSGQMVTLLNNGGDPLTLAANESFIFTTPVVFGSSYIVTVGTQPNNQICTVSNGSGSGVNANISNISVKCSNDTYTIGGSISGLDSGQIVTLLNNGSDPLTISANESFTFSTPVVFGSSYSVTVGTQPNNQTCTVSNGSGAGVNANITKINVICSNDTYTVGGTISGLASGQIVTLLNNGSDPLTISANESFTFSTPVVFGGSYSVTVGTQPNNQTCTVNNGHGAAVNANINSISVVCSNDTYTIGGTLNGLDSGQSVTLLNNGSDPLTIVANQSFVFSVPVAYGSSYNVTVGTQPVNQVCSVSNGNGSGVNANISNISVICSNDTYTIGGTISGLFPGQEINLYNNLADILTVSANGSFTFSTQEAKGSSYNVTVDIQPKNQVCTIVNGNGTNINADVNNVLVSCVYDLYDFGSKSKDGNEPVAALVQATNGSFYGATNGGGTNGNGTVFQVTSAGVENTLYNFMANSNDGSAPLASLIQGSDGNLYGTTSFGGTYNMGTVFRITTGGSETVIYNFGSNPSDGSIPSGCLVQGGDGSFYGTTSAGGSNKEGVIFKLTPAGNETILHAFSGGSTDGAFPVAGLSFASDGNLYGTTSGGGAYGKGSVFKISPSGGPLIFLYGFGGTVSDGNQPDGNLLLNPQDGNFYSTTMLGGLYNSGTVFKISPSGSETVIYSFGNSAIHDGQQPINGLILGLDNNLYGTTPFGGVSDQGIVFKMTTAGNETILYNFQPEGNSGHEPNPTIIQGSDGNFYGTTSNSGPHLMGMVWKLLNQ